MTSTTSTPPPLSRKKRLLFLSIIFSFFIILLLSLGEIISRQKIRPWKILPREAVVASLEPPGTYNLKHETLGYTFRPGRVRITLPGPYSFNITHLPNGLRITHPLDTYPAKEKKEIWIFGCSLTEGWSVNDEETYPWLLQEKFKDYEVVNFGGGGYSTVQSLIQFREALQSGKKPALVILTYASFHDQRNTLTRSWRKVRIAYGGYHNLRGMNLPYMKWSGDKKPEILYQPLDYHEFPLARHSALANLIDETYNGVLEKTYHSHEVSEALIDEFFRVCAANQIKFVVAGIFAAPATTDMLEYCTKSGMMTTDISVDLGAKENTNLPYDSHPSAVAHRKYAQQLESYLCENLIKEAPCLGR